MNVLFLLALLICSALSGLGQKHDKQVPGEPYTVGYSARGLLIDGMPRVLTAGSMHYPRSAPGMWDSLMKKAKAGGLNTIDTYVFWNMHEPTKGHYDFATDRANLPLFLETAQRNGLFVVLRIGPYVCAEWNYGGFPQWLRHEQGIEFRTYSEPFMREMKRFVGKVLDVAKPYMPERGGAVVALQIENEYGDHQWEFGKDGDRYAEWCGETAHSFNASVPWVMCHQYSRVPYVIPTQNNFYCDQYLDRYHRDHPDFPDMWTEMWPAWFQRWGEPAPHRPIEDVAYAVAKWFAHGGTYVAYYMYQGGTNFGRTSGPFIQTSYDYEGFLDEYGLENWPKYLHVAELHKHLLEHSDVITGNPVPARRALAAAKGRRSSTAYAKTYGSSSDYLAFLINADATSDIGARYDGMDLVLPRWSVTLVRKRPEDQAFAVLYNSATLSANVKAAQKHPAYFEHISSPALDASTKHAADRIMRKDSIRMRPIGLPFFDGAASAASVPSDRAAYKRPPEHISITDDATDYLWYHTTVTIRDLCKATDARTLLVLRDAGDVASVYLDGQYMGMRYGQQDRLATFTFDVSAFVAANSNNGTAELRILSQTMGMAHNQRHMEAYARGLLGSVELCGHDITEGVWHVQPGLEGEEKEEASHSPDKPPLHGWKPYHDMSDELATRKDGESMIRWYAIDIDATALVASDKGESPRYGIDLSSMTKGHVWINGHHLGRYWLRRAPAKESHKPCQQCTYGGWYWPDNVCRQGCGDYSQR
ncbi:Beta-galactosidase-1-like protein, partial [Coemansia erecta]